MDAVEFKRLEDVYWRAIKAGPGQRLAMIEDACGGDATLLEEARTLFRLRDRMDPAFLDQPVCITDSTLFRSDPAPSPEFSRGDRIDSYEVLDVVGGGGMSVVYRVQEDPPLGRLLALKVMKRTGCDRTLIARFEQECQALARLRHPGIATVFEAGTTDDGRPSS